ncbi:MAG: ABC transporter permease [Lachnospiraceae bacterium]|jgi:ribose transport system permease protein|nr:ABC transporter permease [Lachnospiraceae bacterium]
MKGKSKNWLNMISDHAGLVALVVLIFVGIIFTDSFATGNNISNLVRQICINGILASGFTAVVISDGFDFSVGNILSACAVVIIPMLNVTGNIPLILLVSIAIGVAFGAINGLTGKIIKSGPGDAYLITLATSFLAQGFAYIYSKGDNTFVDDSLVAYRNIARGEILGIPNTLLCMAAMMLLTQFLLRKTRTGRALYMVGSNKVATYASGINAHNIRTFAYVYSGFCAAIAAIVMTARTGSAAPAMGMGYEGDAAIATFIGGCAAGSYKSSMVRTLVGVVVVGLITNIMNLMNINSIIQSIVKGIILIIVLCAQQMKKE